MQIQDLELEYKQTIQQLEIFEDEMQDARLTSILDKIVCDCGQGGDCGNSECYERATTRLRAKKKGIMLLPQLLMCFLDPRQAHNRGLLKGLSYILTNGNPESPLW